MFGRTVIYLIILLFSFWSALADENGHANVSEDVLSRSKILHELGEMKVVMDNVDRRLVGNTAFNTTLTRELAIFDIRFDAVPEKCKMERTPINCEEATICIKRNGVYKIKVAQYSNEPFLVECDAKTANGGWIIVQRRNDGSEDFYLDWPFYQRGFGTIQGEFFIGLEKLHALTNFLGPQELMIILEDEKVYRYARYNSFVIGNATEHYTLKSVGQYSGTAGDSLQHHVNMQFTTRERDNDHDVSNCAQRSTGAWWYNKCHLSNLNGKYGDNLSGKGINWHTFMGSDHSIQYVKMMIRRRRE